MTKNSRFVVPLHLRSSPHPFFRPTTLSSVPLSFFLRPFLSPSSLSLSLDLPILLSFRSFLRFTYFEILITTTTLPLFSPLPAASPHTIYPCCLTRLSNLFSPVYIICSTTSSLLPIDHTFHPSRTFAKKLFGVSYRSTNETSYALRRSSNSLKTKKMMQKPGLLP